MDEKESALPDRRLQQDEAERHRQSYAYRTYQQTYNFRQIPFAECLRGHSTGTHAQETENPVDDVEQHSAYGNGADIGR